MGININICILNWNGGEDLHDCIRSIKANKSNSYKITVIDNNSSDLSTENLPVDIDVVKLNENFGFGVGYNKGISECISDDDDYIILLNNDTIVAPDFIESVLNSINKRGKNYIYGAKILYHDNNSLIWYGGGNVDLSKGVISHKSLRDYDDLDQKSSFTDFITGCCMILHKDIFFKLNGFDSRFFMYNEDVDFCLRAKKSGVNLIYEPSIRVFHKVSSSLGGNYSYKKIIKKLKSTFALYNKYYSWYKCIPLFSLYIAKSILGIRKL